MPKFPRSKTLNNIADDHLPPSPARGVVVSTPVAVGVAALLSIAGLVAIWSAMSMLWALWTTDALKSIGMVVPVVSFLLILRVWRSLGWEMRGTWWGMVVLLVTAILVQFHEHTVLTLVLAPEWSLSFPPPSLVMFAYGVGLVLLFGGVRLARAAWFPLVLLLFVNPIPHIFNVYVDLPLQRASAHVARAFAMALGQPLSPDKLRLMFTPEFGMFIAPGCNGIRGAVTMGLIALVAGYLYRFRWKAHVLTVACAILLGYVFNFVRLCVLVLYYVVALHFTWLQERAEGGDYVIGAVLFFIAVYLLSVVIARQGAPDQDILRLPQVAPIRRNVVSGRSFLLRAAAMTVFVLLGAIEMGRAQASVDAVAMRPDEGLQMGYFPKTAGGYHLARTWNETLIGGALLFHWADYAPAGDGPHIAVGVSPVMGAHDTLVCHSARGDDPLWRGQDTISTAGEPVSFSSAFFNDGATQSLEASTICDRDHCGEYATDQKHFGFVYSRISPDALFARNPARPIPVLLKVETTDTTIPAAQARAQLTGSLDSFLRGIDLKSLTTPYRGL